MDHVAGIGSPQGSCKAVAGYVAKGSEGQLRKQGGNSSGADPIHRRIKKMLSKGLRSHSAWCGFTTPARTAKKSDFAKRTKRLEEKTPDQLTEEQVFPAALRGVLIVKDAVFVKCDHDAANWRLLHLYMHAVMTRPLKNASKLLNSIAISFTLTATWPTLTLPRDCTIERSTNTKKLHLSLEKLPHA
jgi:hypothetical protein